MPPCLYSGYATDMPYNIAPTVSLLLQGEVNKGLAELTGSKVNRGAGYGLEIPSTYYRPKAYIERLKKLLACMFVLFHNNGNIFLEEGVVFVALRIHFHRIFWKLP